MNIQRATHSPGELLEFYEQGLASLGALCDRTWHDRLTVIAEGRPATLWNPAGDLHEVELHFAPAEATSARDAAREVFPGCPLTFQLAEALRPTPLSLDRFILPDSTGSRPPEAAIAEKNWRGQFPDTSRFQLASTWKPDFHFSLVAVARCEIQAMDQHWSLHRVAVSLTDDEMDEHLADELNFHQTTLATEAEIDWPAPDPAAWCRLLQKSFEQELTEEMTRIRARQENSLRRELERIDDYFQNYEQELATRARRSSSENSKLKGADRLAAAKAEHTRRRADQVARHEIRVFPHVDLLLLVAEKAWSAQLKMDKDRTSQTVEALFIPRSRKWKVKPQKSK